MKFTDFSERVAHFNKHPEQLPTVLVLYGGETNERAISIASGKAVAQGLRDGKTQVIEYEVTSWQRLIHHLLAFKNDVKCGVVFSLIHGGKGEDGTLHALLDMMLIPYVGSDQLASALAMNKTYCKKIWAELGLNIPSSLLLQSLDEAKQLNGEDFPLIIKPNNEGSSNGITRVEHQSELKTAMNKALEYSDQVLIEQFIEGTEVTVALLDNEPLVPIEIVPAHGIYDYHAKYVSDDTQFFCPPKNIVESKFSLLQKHAKIAYQAINAKHWGRVDFIIDQNLTPWILEVNLIPGMTSHSLVPQAAKQKGINFSQLVCGLVTLPEAQYSS